MFKRVLLFISLIVILTIFLSPYLQFLGIFKPFAIAGVALIMERILYRKKKGFEFANINAEGVSQLGELIPWGKIETIKFNGNRACIYTTNGSITMELSAFLIDKFGELNDIRIEPCCQFVMSRLPNSEEVRVCFTKKTAHRKPLPWPLIGSLLAGISMFLVGYILQDAIILMAVFVLAGLFFTRNTVFEFRSLWFIYHSGILFNPGDSLCINLDATGLNYQVNGESTHFGWNDIQSFTVIFEGRSSYDSGYTLLNIKGNSKLTIPLFSPKLVRALANFTGFTQRSENEFAEYYGI